MGRPYVEEQLFQGRDFTTKPLQQGDYEACIFTDCNFSGSDLSGIRFIECSFKGCNLSNAPLKKTSFQEVKFGNCKMLGLQFENCQLDLCSFYQVRLSQTLFINSKIHEADFRGAFNYTFDPGVNRVKGALFSQPSLFPEVQVYQPHQ